MVSQKYINQLLEDIRSAHRSENIEPVSKEITESVEFDPEKYFKEVEEFIGFDEKLEPIFGEIIGLELVQFPKAEELSSLQLEHLYEAFIAMISSYNVTLDIPEAMPLPSKYTVSLSVLNDPLFLPDDGEVTWEICNYDPGTCLYGEYCQCIEEDRLFEQNIEDACQLLNDITDGCNDLINRHGHMNFVIDNSEEVDSVGLICMYIAAGSDYVPFEIYQNAIELKQACEKLCELFSTDLEIVSLFDDIGKYNSWKNLEVFLSLNVFKYEGNAFHVEPYYIENGFINKGYAPVSTPEELIKRLEAEDDNIYF